MMRMHHLLDRAETAKDVDMTEAGSAPSGSAPTQPGQARSVERRAQLLAAALRLLLGGGAVAVTHRGVAEAASSSPGAVRYHFRTREDLLAACLEEIERARAVEAERIIEGVRHGGPFGVDTVARMLLTVYYGPEVDDATVVGTFWSIVDCGRESPRLAHLLGEHRRRATGQLDEMLSATGYRKLQPNLAGAVLDGGIQNATVEGISPVTESAATDLATILRMVEA